MMKGFRRDRGGWFRRNKNRGDSTQTMDIYYTRTTSPEPAHQQQHDDHEAISSYESMPEGGGDAAITAAGDDASVEVYIVRQKYGYCSIFFSVVQTIVLALMMWQCGVAPLRLNPMLGPYPDALSEWGGKNSVLILEDGETYRLITPIFLHAGLFHLLGNVAVQLETGLFFEKEWGSVRWLLVYLVSAVGSSVLSVIAMPLAVSVGSSGAVMGLFGGKLAEVLLRACERRVTKQDHVAHQVRKEQCFIATFSVILVMLFSFIPFVDWAAHLGGLATGFIFGLMVFAWEIEGYVWKVLWFVIGTVVTVTCFTLAFQYMYSGEVETMEELAGCLWVLQGIL